VNSNLIRLYFLTLEERGIKGTTQNGAGRAIRVFLNFCVSEEWIPQSPMRRIKLPRVDQTILPPFDPKEVKLRPVASAI
jgi:site-specific recombinase XerD